MRQIEQDLDTALDWLVVDHFNTGQPHTHIVARGVTDQGKILYIAGDYIAHGIRARASDLVTRQLGRQTELEVQQKLGREVDHDRFTRLDRTLLAEPEDGRVDLRISPGQSYLVRANRHLLIARLRKLEAMELADPVEPGVWELSPRLEWALKHLGQRIDTIGIMQRALGEEAAERSVSHFTIHRDLPRSPVTGHLRGKGLAGDGLADKVHLVIDGVDGRVHYVELDAVLVSDDARIGAILTVGKEPSARSVDKTIAALAARNHGFYDPSQHAEIARHRVETTPMGFGHKVEKALERRQETLIARSLAYRLQDGSVRYQPDLLATLQRREIDRAGERLAARSVERLTYVPARDGASVRGIYRGSVALTGGRFAVVADERQFTLVPWRQLLERFRGREVTGIVRGMGVSWQLGLQRTRGLSR